jgi:pyrimidine-nucleoside phosphorylase
MSIIDWIETKKRGEALSDSALGAIVRGFIDGTIADYQMSALLMAIVLRGLDVNETITLTRAMVESGDVLDLSTLSGPIVDKHSTGGVGDKVTLALVPILAAAGVKVPKMSGHGLGATGGTLDKLESIPGFVTELSNERIVAQLQAIGACICAQSDRLAPADRAIYALRDVTGTVDSIGLIASSILSKKIACGAQNILIDVKIGSGAFMRSPDDAFDLSQMLIEVGAAFGKRIVCANSDMDQPLGRAVGNRIEIIEILQLLRCETVDKRLLSLTLALSDEALAVAGKSERAAEIVASGRAYAAFARIVHAQGGDLSRVEANVDQLPYISVNSPATGYVSHIDAATVADVARALGAGRMRKGATIDPAAGVWLTKTMDEPVRKGEEMARLLAADSIRVTPALQKALADAYTITHNRSEERDMIQTILSSKDFQ